MDSVIKNYILNIELGKPPKYKKIRATELILYELNYEEVF